jgi:hypothetical protein
MLQQYLRIMYHSGRSVPEKQTALVPSQSQGSPLLSRYRENRQMEEKQHFLSLKGMLYNFEQGVDKHFRQCHNTR